MAPRDNCIRLALVLAVFVAAVILLGPHIFREGEVPSAVELGSAEPAHKTHGDDGGYEYHDEYDGDREAAGDAPDGVAAIATVPAAAEPSSQAANPSTPKPSTPPPSNPNAPTSSVSAPNILTVGQILSPFVLASPSGRYALRLEHSGQLVLRDTHNDAELFVSDTEFFWPADWHVELTQDAVLQLSWRNDTAAPYAATPWVSSMLAGCSPVVSQGHKDTPVLELLDSGRLHIRMGTEVACVLHRAEDDAGRLAIVYTGFLRTYLQTCDEQNAKLVKSWTGSGGVDVHVFAYLEDVYHQENEPVNAESIRKHLEKCFGPALKTMELHNLESVQELAKDAEEGLVKKCGQEKLNHQLSQWKALYLAGQQVRKYMLKKAVEYDYIFKGRLDLQLWGDIPPLSSIQVPKGGIVAPRVAYDWTWYSMLHTGELRAGVTDITAFGRPAEMFTYLSLYREFLDLAAAAILQAQYKAFNSKARVKYAEGQEACTPESVLAYWLHMNGISVKTDWRFGMGLLRGSGELIFTCPNKERTWMCPGFIPEAAQDGTLKHP